MTLCQILKYASKVGICSTEMFEVLARNGQPRPLPMVEMRIEVFTEEAFNKLSQLLIELGTEQATGLQNGYSHGNNHSRESGLSRIDR